MLGKSKKEGRADGKSPKLSASMTPKVGGTVRDYLEAFPLEAKIADVAPGLLGWHMSGEITVQEFLDMYPKITQDSMCLNDEPGSSSVLVIEPEAAEAWTKGVPNCHYCKEVTVGDYRCKLQALRSCMIDSCPEHPEFRPRGLRPIRKEAMSLGA